MASTAWLPGGTASGLLPAFPAGLSPRAPIRRWVCEEELLSVESFDSLDHVCLLWRV